MSNARNLADLLGTNTTIQTAKLADDAITGAKLPTGSVLQVKRGVLTSVYNTTGSYADTGLDVSITPSSTSSTIYIITHCNCYVSSSRGIGLRFARGSTSIYDPSASNNSSQPYIYYSADSGYSNVSFDFVDSPATTSAITYKLQARYYSGTTARLNTDDATDAKSSITVMEIAG